MSVPKDVLVRTRMEAEKYRHVYASLESQIFEKGRLLYERSRKILRPFKPEKGTLDSLGADR